MQMPFTKWIFALISAALAAWALTEVVLLSQNTLLRNGSWSVEKCQMRGALTGGDDFLLARDTLAGNSLHLGKWYGFQEIRSRFKRDFEEIEFRFRLTHNQYLIFFFGPPSKNFHALRLSRDEDSPTAALRITAQGRFAETTLLNPPIPLRGWHTVRVLAGGDRLEFHIDGKKIHSGPKDFSEPALIGFRSGLKGALVDDIVIVGQDGSVFEESFRNRKAAIWIWLAHFLLLLAAAMLIGRSAPALSALSHSVLVCALAFWAFDFWHWSRFPFSPIRETPALETARQRTFAKWHGWLTGFHVTPRKVYDEGYPFDRFVSGPLLCEGGDLYVCRFFEIPKLVEMLEARPEGRRILWVGTSQTIGAGAPILEKTFVVRLHALLNHALANDVLTLNLALSGSNPEELSDLYLQLQAMFRPTLVLINLAENGDDKQFSSGIKAMLAHNLRHKIPTVVIAEPNTREALSGAPDPRYEMLKTWAAEYGAKYWDLNAHLSQPNVHRSGVIWWDIVHLTSFGHDLATEYLFPRILKLIK